MFLDELFDKMRRLPFNEQQLFIKMNVLLIESYKKNRKYFGENEAIKELYDLYDYIENMTKVSDNNNDFQKTK